jgi:formylmethanofuran dehydrogenase subunit E
MLRCIALLAMLCLPTLLLAEDRLPTPDYQRQPSDPEWLVQVVQYHGHLGPSIIAAARMGMIGLRAADAKGYFDVEVTCEGPLVKPPQSCFLDGLQVATGATLGKRTLTWRPADQLLVRIKNTRTGKTAELHPTPQLLSLFPMPMSQPKPAEAKPAQSPTHEHLEAVARKIAAMPAEEIAEVKVTEGKAKE